MLARAGLDSRILWRPASPSANDRGYDCRQARNGVASALLQKLEITPREGTRPPGRCRPRALTRRPLYWLLERVAASPASQSTSSGGFQMVKMAYPPEYRTTTVFGSLTSTTDSRA